MAEKCYNIEETLKLVLEDSDEEFLDSEDEFVADVQGEDLQPLNFPETLDNIPAYERDSMLFMDSEVTTVCNKFCSWKWVGSLQWITIVILTTILLRADSVVMLLVAYLIVVDTCMLV